MKKLLALWMFIIVFTLMSGTASPQAEYIMEGQNPFDLTLGTTPPYDCQYLTIALDPNGLIYTPLILAGFWLTYDDMHVSVRNIAVYDGELVPALWDPAFTSKLPPGETGSYFLSVGNFATVSLDDLRIADVEFCLEGTGQSQITVSTIPGFDTVVGGTTVWDPQITNGIIDLQIAQPCSCELDGPTSVEADAFYPVTAQYTGTFYPGPNCENPPEYLYTTTCTVGGATIDHNTGLLTVGPYVGIDEECTICVMDRANTDINTGEPIECCMAIEIWECW